MIKKILYTAAFLVTAVATAQESDITTRDLQVNELLPGTLFSAGNTPGKKNLIILIAGSGPTDRYGNAPGLGLKCNSLKYLAEGLVSNTWDIFSFDKRIFALARSGKLDESKLRFEELIGDVKDIIAYFEKDYDKIVLAGHSEGSLIGMMAMGKQVDAFISLAGPGRDAGEVMEEQIAANSPMLDTVQTGKYISLLKEGKTFVPEGPVYKMIFRERVQPYVISWMKYTPAEEIKKLSVPVLIVNGTRDLQVKPSEARLLKKAQPGAELVVIEGMNHIFKEVREDRAANLGTYSNPDLPVVPELLEKIRGFLNASL
ncbi:alpha/beta hydrolase [Sinomicrobium weinanense]|uniref:Alpha/beta hydrolase n=1 Tax=Sinomicrobium weinanense TaxID=2842200 RepID=A0A926JRN0_9FLAO|nr:alpha/beta fold hydrolase [Sinomicrobium weinanense]MBC9796235.1 alpha/beta hydrolase [Sinomicrobium weinanense]MBU3122310.1 alpha/beta hydrolase [Sinomicrobium weinanense]